MARKKKLYLIDGFSQIFRAYYAPASFRNRSQAGGAAYIFTRMLLKIIDKGKPDAIVCAMDSRGIGGVRSEYFPEYKAHRDPMPEDLAEQLPHIERIIDCLGVTRIEGGEYEADDVIGTLATQAEKAGYQVRIITRDKDLKQLLSDNVYLYDADDGSLYGPEELEIELGLTPDQFIDYLALMGDKVDNIPGAVGIGPKKAQAFLQEYGTLQGVLDAADGIKQPKTRENLIAFREQAPISYKLATIVRDMPIAEKLEELHFDGLKQEQVLPVFQEYGFRRLISELGWEDDAAESDAASPTARSSAKPSERVKRDSSNSASADEKPEKETAKKTAKKRASKRKSSESSGPGLFDSMPESSATSESAPAEAKLSAEGRGNYKLINSLKELKAFVKELKKQKLFALDTETTSIDAHNAELVGICISWAEGEGTYIAVAGPQGEEICDLEETLALLKPILEDEKIGKIGQNIKYDLLVLRHHGVHVRGVKFDTMIAAYLADNTRQEVGMNQLSEHYLSYTPIPISTLLGTDKKSQKTMRDVPTADAAIYGAEDADITWRLARAIEPEIEELEITKLSSELEMPLVEVLADMEYEGVRIDLPYLEELSIDFEKRIGDIEQKCFDAAGRKFTINSPKQLGEILFDELGLEAKSKTAKGKRSTAVDVLEQLARDHELPDLVLQYRHLSKLKSTYIDALPKLVDEHDRVHTSFRQAVSTGRLASTDPNVQNIPVRSEEGKKIRKAFIARDDKHVLVVADYSQIELRVLAHLGGDEVLRKAFRDNKDIHRTVAAEVNGIDESAVNSDMRSQAKAIHFGILYGQGAHGLSQALGIPRKEAQDFIDRYFARFPSVREFIERTHEQAQAEEYVSTMLGRRRKLPGVNDRNRGRQAQALRQAFNTVIQGSAADLIKLAMLRVHERIREEGLPFRLLIQVHDELMLEAPKSKAKQAVKFICEEMENAYAMDVPLVADAGFGSNWLAAKGE